MNKTERQETVESLTEQFRASPNLYVTDFTGLNVLRMTEFRRRLPAYTISSFRDERLCANDVCRSQRERYYAGLAKAGLPE